MGPSNARDKSSPTTAGAYESQAGFIPFFSKKAAMKIDKIKGLQRNCSPKVITSTP
jgi:hypothetical protein